MSQFIFETAQTVICEPGASNRLADIVKDLGIFRLMLVTDPGLVSAGIVDPVVQSLQKSGVSVYLFKDVLADPPESLVLQAINAAREEMIDGVIGFGGGSSMDVAKLIAVLTNSSQEMSEIYGIGNVVGDRLPLIQVPTTAGTGSEVTPISIVTTGETTKTGVVSKQLLPDVAILDAELTVGLPPATTAATGIDAMVHAIEAYTSKHKKNIYSDMLAKQALSLMARSLRKAVDNGKDIQARSDMLLGAMMAGQAFANSPVAAVHALAYPLGGHYHIPHGLSNSLVLPAVLQFNADDASVQYTELLHCLDPDIKVVSYNEGAAAFIKSIEQLIDDVKLPKTLREVEVPENDLPMLADDAMLQQRLLVNNPREVQRDDALAIYQSVY